MSEFKTTTAPEEADAIKITALQKQLLTEQVITDLQLRKQDPSYLNERLIFFGDLFAELDELSDATHYEGLRRSQQLRNTIEYAFGKKSTEVLYMWKTQKLNQA